MKQTTERLRCNLTDDEKILAGKELAEQTSKLREIEEEKAQVVSEFKARTTAAEAMITVLGNKIRSGYEFRDVECKTELDDPEPGRKTTYRTDTLEIVRQEEMTEEEKQRELPL